LPDFFVDAGFIDALAAPFDGAADFGEREFDKLAHRTGLAGRQHEIVGRVRLQYPVHALDKIPGVAPIALGLEIAEIERLMRATLRVILRVTNVSPRIGISWLNRKGFLLRHLLDQAVEFRGRGLIESRLLFHAENPDRLQKPQHADDVGIGGVFRAFEADADSGRRDCRSRSA
jgi:hypothetical protein